MEIVFPILLIFVAFAYAMVGHGGASGYLALGILFAMSPEDLRPQVLYLNLLVAGFSFIAFAREGYFRAKLLLPVIAISVPAAFVGARWQVSTSLTQGLLGFALLAASGRMLMPAVTQKEKNPHVPALPVLLLAGGLLGLLAGMTGVGGGIYLSPLLLLMGWAAVKETAATSAAFIWLNSVAGLVGLYSVDALASPPLAWIAAAFAGGFAGSWVGAKKMTPGPLRMVLAAMLLMAAVKLLWKSLS